MELLYISKFRCTFFLQHEDHSCSLESHNRLSTLVDSGIIPLECIILVSYIKHNNSSVSWHMYYICNQKKNVKYLPKLTILKNISLHMVMYLLSMQNHNSHLKGKIRVFWSLKGVTMTWQNRFKLTQIPQSYMNVILWRSYPSEKECPKSKYL